MQNDSFGGIPVTTDNFGGQLADDAQPKRKRSLASIANDTVIEVANAAAGGVSSAANFVKPGNTVSGWIDKNIVKAGEANQSDAVKAEKQRFQQDVANADGVMGELGAVGRYVVNNPVLSAAQAVGSFVGPGAAVKGGRTLASIAGLNAARGGLAGGAAAGAAMAGGDAAGTAYDLATKGGATEAQAVAAARGASVIPAVIGGVGGVVGAERLVAGAKGFAGNAASRALKTGAVEGAQEAIEEGVTQYEGQRAAMPYDKTIDPMKGVAAAAGMGAALGGATGGGVSLLTGGHHQQQAAPVGVNADDPSVGVAAAPAQPAAPAIDPNAGPLSKAASMAGDLGLVPQPAPPTAQEQRVTLEATISRLPEAQQREARMNLADLDNQSLPAGVRAMRNARLQELVGGAPAAPVELTPQDMERGRVVQNFDARAPGLSPVENYAPLIEEAIAPERQDEYRQLLSDARNQALSQDDRTTAAEILHATFSPDQLQQARAARPTPDTRLTLQDPAPTRYDNSLDFTAPTAPTPVPDSAAGRINQLALDANLTPGEPMQLNKAHALRRAAAAEGIAMSVIPHPSGRGYDVAPTARLDPAARTAMPQDEAAAQLPYDQSPSGRMVASSGGGVRAETRPEAVARGNAAAAQRQEVESERQRRSELGLSNITPVAPLAEAGNPAPPRVAFDNASTGRMVAGADGVRAERRAEVVNRANQPAPAPQTVASTSGAPFASRQVAQQALQRQQLAGTHEVVPAGGDESLGFVLQEKGRNQPPALDGKAQAATESVADRAPNWRTNALQANRIARGLGIDTKGKRVAEVVAEIDAHEGAEQQSPQYPEGASMRDAQGQWQPAVRQGREGRVARPIDGAPTFAEAGAAARWSQLHQLKGRKGADVESLVRQQGLLTNPQNTSKSTPTTRAGDIARGLRDDIDNVAAQEKRPGMYRQEAQRLRQAAEGMTSTSEVRESFAAAADMLDAWAGKVATTTMSTTVSAPELVAASADVESAGGTSGPLQGGGLQQDRPPRSGPRAEAEGNQDPALDVKAPAAIKSGVNPGADGPGAARAAAPRSTTMTEDFQPASVDSVRDAVRELVNGIGALPNQLGRVVVATSQEIQQHWQPLIGPVSMESEDTGRVEGFYDPKTKTVFLIADNIRKGDEMAVAAHELMHKHGQAVLGDAGWNQLHDAIGTWAKAAPGSTERAVYDEAARRVRATGQELANQEMFPYAVQVALEMGVRPNAMKPQGSVARWLTQVRSALRTVWNKIAGQKGDFNSLDLVNLAFGIAQRENPAHTGELDAAMAESAARAEDALKEISDSEDLFALPKSDKDTVSGIAAEHDPEIKVRTTELGGETMYTLALPDGTRATITSREPTRDEVFGMDQATGRWISARPGENAPPVGSRSDVWVDVSALKPGQNGARVYNIAATFAKNTGRIFIGDPSGLSDAALRRRAEQMLSSALKFGTTDHLAPHPRQVAGDAALGVPPLRWVYGDHAGNIERLVDVNQQALENAYPDANNLRYDLDTGNFINARTDEVVSRAELAELAGRSTPRASGSMERAAEAGWRTVARGAVFRALLREGSPSGESGGQGGRLLDGLVRQRAQLASASERSGDRIFYSRRGVTPGEPDAPALAQRIGAAIQGATVTNLKQQAGFKATDYMPIGLQFLGRRQLVDVYGKLLPQLDTYNTLMAQMDADKNEAGAGADELATAWGKLPDERQLAELMHDATLAQIDPAKDFVEGDNKTDWMRLQAQYKALSPAARETYDKARDIYRTHMREVRSAIKERIERSEMDSQRKADMLKRMDDEFFGHIKGVYFPLARFGQYVVVVKDAEGKTVNVSRAETMAEANATRQQLQTPFPASKGFTVGKVLKSKEFVADRDTVGRGFMEQLYGVLDKQGMNGKQKAELEDALGQLYLSSLPDLSWAKHGIHRKGTPGYSQDARRAFAQNVFHGASYLAKLRYSDQLQDQLSDMEKHVSARDNAPGFDSVRARQVVDEMQKRHEAAMNPKSNSLSTALTSLGFIYHLGLSPASAMVNLTQTALVAYPVMGARWGYGKASAALMKASQEAVRGKNDITTALNADEKAAFEEAVRSGVVDVTMAHDLAGIAQGEDSGVMWKFRPVMKWASFLFHHAEKFNRQVTFVAAYRLARETGAESTKAYMDAVKATYDGHFDYSSNNRPRVMQGNAARVLLLFKQYGQNMVYTMVRQAQLSLKGASPKERADARKALGGLLVMHGLAAGALGLPMVTTLLAAASMLGGDDDEPWDAQVALQNMLADTFGQKPAEVMAHGMSRLTPWDISGRVGLDKLIFPDIQEGLEGQRLGESAMAAALGPVAGIGINLLKGLQEMGEGRYKRGLETMAPSVLRGPVKAWRYGTEGVQDKSGIVVQDEVGAAELLGQASGFSPSSVRNSFEGKSAIVKHDRALQARRSALVEQFAMAAMAGDEEGKVDAREDIAKFNEKNPNRRIQPMQLAQSVNMRQKRIREAQEGVYLPGKRRDALEAGRFAVPE